MTTKTLSGLYLSTYKIVASVDTVSITASGYLLGGLLGAGSPHRTIVNAGAVLGGDYGIKLSSLAMVTNSGTVTATGTSSSASAIYLAAGGTVSNSAAGLLVGSAGVALKAAGVVNNAGTIVATAVAVAAEGGALTLNNTGVIEAVGTSTSGVFAMNGGVVNNGDASHTAARIAAGVGVVLAGNGAVHNFGTIVGRVTGSGPPAAIYMQGGSVINGSEADTTASIYGAGGVFIIGGAGTVTNFATIGGLSSLIGVGLLGGGQLTSGSDTDTKALIQGYTGVAALSGAATVHNYGRIQGAVGSGMGTLSFAAGVYLGAGGLVTNGDASDTAATIQGASGLFNKAGAATVANFGTISDIGLLGDVVGAGVVLEGGGAVTNGAVGDAGALISGRFVGVLISGAVGSVTNLGVIKGGAGIGTGVEIMDSGVLINGASNATGALISGRSGAVVQGSVLSTVVNYGTIVGLNGYGAGLNIGKGVLANGSETVTTALISGFVGVAAQGPAVLNNFGTIKGAVVAGQGVSLGVTGERLVNGSATDAKALITGSLGVEVAAGATATNFGTIEGVGVHSVLLDDATSKLYAEAGSVFKGQIEAAMGFVDFVSGVSTISGIDSAGIIAGPGTMALLGGASVFQPGVSVTVAHVTVAGVHASAEFGTSLSYAGTWVQTGGTLTVDSSYQASFTGVGDAFTGTIAGAGKVVFAGGSDTLKAVTLSVATAVINTATVTLSGLVTIAGTLTATTTDLIVASTGATLAGGGTLTLTNKSTNRLYGATPTALLTNNDKITGAGQLGSGMMTLSNGAAGVINANNTVALIIDTGAAAITNAGLIEATSSGGLVIQSAVKNTGTLAALGGNLTVNANVTGSGSVRIGSGTADFEGVFSEAVTFGATGQLTLAHSTGYNGTISGFSQAGTNSIDLKAIAFATAKVSFSGTAASGTVTITDGSHTAHIKLSGDYTASTFVLADDGGGGTLVHDPAKAKMHASPPVFAQAMAHVGTAPPSSASVLLAAASRLSPLLTPPRPHL